SSPAQSAATSIPSAAPASSKTARAAADRSTKSNAIPGRCAPCPGKTTAVAMDADSTLLGDRYPQAVRAPRSGLAFEPAGELPPAAAAPGGVDRVVEDAVAVAADGRRAAARAARDLAVAIHDVARINVLEAPAQRLRARAPARRRRREGLVGHLEV